MKRSICFVVLAMVLSMCVFSQSVQEIQSDSESKTGLLTVKTNVSGAEVYINGAYEGRAPFQTELVPGVYTVKVAKSGYYSETCSISISANKEIVVFLDLERITGYIDFSANEKDTVFYVDGNRITGKSAEVPEGVHTIEAKLFGYETYKETVVVFARIHTLVPVVLKKAEFNVSDLSVSLPVFNPENPGTLGTSLISFEVTAPGSGKIEVLNASGAVVADYSFDSFSTWQQSWAWDGRINGSKAPDGKYSAVLTAMADKSVVEINTDTDSDETSADKSIIKKTISLQIDYSLSYQLLGYSSTGLGVGLVPSSRLFPKGTLYTGITVEPLFNISNASLHAVPVFCNFSATPFSWLEFSCRAGVWLREYSPTPLGFGAAVKFGSSKENFSFAGFLQYEIVTQNLLGITTEAGLKVGGALGYKIGLFHFDLSSVYVFGPERGLINSLDSCWGNSLSVLFQVNNFSTGIWGGLYSAVGKPEADSSFVWNDKAGGGIDFSVLLPSTSILLTAKGYCLANIPQAIVHIYSSIGFAVIY